MRRLTAPPASIWDRARNPLAALSALIVIVAMVRWGGTARPGPLFVAGVALLLGMVVAFGLAGWWLYLSPLRAADQPRAGSVELRRLVAVFVPVVGLLFIVGGTWDEAWHKVYGSFGDDFLWPPHFLLYASLGMIALFAVGAVALLLRGGDVRRRFRDEPLIGLIALVACYLIASLPADQLWHIIYGVDLTAWSLPHISITVGFLLVMLSAIALQLSFVTPGPWRGLRGLRRPEVWSLFQIACGVLPLVQLGTTEWDGITSIGAIGGGEGEAFARAFWQRPEWLYPVVVTALGLFSASLALHTLRRAGAATLVALVIAGFRAAAVAYFEATEPGLELGLVSFLLLVPPAIALDLWYAARLGRADTDRGRLAGRLLASAVGLAVTLPVVALTFVYPRVNAATLPWMIGVSLLIGLAAGWVGAQAGDWLATRERPAVEPAPARPLTRLASLGVSCAAIAFALALILTAQAPSAG